MPKTEYIQKTVHVNERTFLLRVQRFGNGYIISVSEGGTSKLGSMVISLAHGTTNKDTTYGQPPVTSTIIPPKDGNVLLFLRLAAEQTSSRCRGIVLTSAFFQKALDAESTKSLLSDIVEMTSDGYDDE